jgi:uncharacterized membrane protein YbhN (UPF0104 family)
MLSTTIVTAPRKSFLRRHAVKLVLSIVITGGVVYTLHQGGLKLVPDGTDFATVKWWYLAAYLPFLLAMTWFRSVRWRFLLRSIVEVPKRRLLAISCVGFCAVLLLPFRLGELARPYLVHTRKDQRKPGDKVLTMTAATSSVVAERVIDGMFLSIVLAIVLVVVPTVHPLPDKVVGLDISVASVRWAGFAMLAIFSTALATIAVFYFARGWAHRATHLVIGKISPKLADKLAGIAEKLADGLHVFGRGRDFLGFLAETAAYWTCNALGMWVLARGCGVVHLDGSPITFPEALGLMGFMGCAIMIPGPPGFLGVFQVGIYAGMTMYFPTSIVVGAGAAYVFLLYLVQVAVHLVAGAWGLWHEGGARRLREELDEEPAPLPAEA